MNQFLTHNHFQAEVHACPLVYVKANIPTGNLAKAPNPVIGKFRPDPIWHFVGSYFVSVEIEERGEEAEGYTPFRPLDEAA